MYNNVIEMLIIYRMRRQVFIQCLKGIMQVVKSYLDESSELLKTSGHTDDSISILLDNRIAVVGDVMVNTFGNFYSLFADD